MIETRPFDDSGSPILVRESDKIGVGALNVAIGSRGGHYGSETLDAD